MRYLPIFIFPFLLGCISPISVGELYNGPGWPGYIESQVSEFDGRSSIKMEPAYLSYGETMLKLGLRWNSSMPEGKYIILAELEGAENFSPDSALMFNVDGKFIALVPVDENQYGVVREKWVSSTGGFVSVPVSLGNYSTKQYWVTENELKSIISAVKTIVRIQLLNSYIEDRIEPSPGMESSVVSYPQIWAKKGFSRFLYEKEKFTQAIKQTSIPVLDFALAATTLAQEAVQNSVSVKITGCATLLGHEFDSMNLRKKPRRTLDSN